MKVKELDDFKSPHRIPWLIVVVVIVVAVLFLWREDRHNKNVKHRAEAATEKFGTVSTEGVKAPAQSPDLVGNPAETKREDVGKAVARAQDLEAKRKFVEAKKIYNHILMIPIDDSVRRSVEARIGKINTDLVFTPYAMPEKTDYVVKRGDSIDKIAQKLGTTVDLISKSNNVRDPSKIKVGDIFRVFTGKFTVKVSKTNIDLVVYMNGEFFKRYNVGTGKFGKTPVGTFIITGKQKEPVWWHPSGKSYQFGEPENILGTRWMSLKATGDTPDVKGYGIHGTWQPQSIGKAESAGCVRMRNEDVEELYMLLPEGTEVEIVE